MEECTDNGSCFVRSAHNEATEIGAGTLKELEEPRGGRAWLTMVPSFAEATAGRRRNLADLTKPL